MNHTIAAHGKLVHDKQAADYDAIGRVNLAAFGQQAEGDLVDALRSAGFARLSLVAELAGELVGHILFSQIEIVGDGPPVPALALAPMAVLPERQRQGIGSALVRIGLDHCRRAGHDIVLVVGHPGYYPRFGFSADKAAPLQSPYAGEAFMALELTPAALQGITGSVRYSPPFESL